MNLRELLFGGEIKDGGSGQGAYRDGIQTWLPIKNVIDGMAATKDNRSVKILGVPLVDICLKSADDRQTIISAYAAYLKITPDSLQLEARTVPADIAEYMERMRRYIEREESAAYREIIEGGTQEIEQGVISEVIRRRLFLVFQYEAQTKARQNTVCSIIQRLNEEADTAWCYLDLYELKVLEPCHSDDSMLKLLCKIINRKISRRLQLPEGMFDMTTTIYGIYEDG